MFRSVSVFEVTALYLHPFNPASMPLFLIIIHANQKNLTAVIFQAVQIVLLFHLLLCLFCGMPPLQLNDQCRQIAVSICFKYNVCKAFVLCEVTGGSFQSNIETTESSYFSLDEIPALAEEKNNKEQIAMCFTAYLDENWKVPFFQTM